MFKVLVSDAMSEAGLLPLLQSSEVELVQKNVNELSQEELSQFDGLFVRSATKVTEAVLTSMPNLKIVARAGVGVDNIDLEAATKRGVVVVNAPDGNTISTAEHTFAMILSAARKIPQAHSSLHRNEWNRGSFSGIELKGKTLGIIGLGRIGGEIAKRAKGFDMDVIVFDPFLTKKRAEAIGVEAVELQFLLETSDVVTVHTPLTNETRGLINRENIYKMKKGVIIVNCARGGIVDEEALYEAIVQKHIGGAALDVFEVEPAPHNRLLELDTVVTTPHIAASTKEAQLNVAVHVSREVLNYCKGLPISSAINAPSISKEVMEKVKPYYDLAKKLGATLSQCVRVPINEIQVSYLGDATIEKSITTRVLLAEFLKGRIDTTVNEVNVPHLCKERGINYSSRVVQDQGGYSNGMVVTAETDQGSFEIRGVHIPGWGTRIVECDGFEVDFDPTGNVLFIQHTDKPGVIGKVGFVLGKHDVNIATMQVGRKNVGGAAVMFLGVDKPLEEATIQELSEMTEIKSLTKLSF